MDSGSIANWNLKEGDHFIPGDVFCSVETDKATVDFEAQDEGFLAKILAQAGSGELKVGEPIMIIVEDGESVDAFKDYQLDSASTTPSSSSSSPSSPTPEPPAATTAASPAPSKNASAPSDAEPKSSGDRIVASPLARKLAVESGYDIGAIHGTGPGGRIVAADVREFVPSQETATSTQAPSQVVMETAEPIPGAGYTDYPLSESAREVAARLAQAKRNVPHYYLTVDISMDQLLALRSRLNGSIGEKDAPVGVYELLIKAAAASMKAVPSANASWLESVVRVYDKVDINIVVGSGDSLYTPVIRDVTAKGLRSISTELSNAVAALDSAEKDVAVSGLGTFTMMNLGMYGVKSCAPIIREPQACALAVGALENRIVPNDDADSEAIYKESIVMTATLSCDHRVVDGAVGAQWLAAFKTHIENPHTLLL